MTPSSVFVINNTGVMNRSTIERGRSAKEYVSSNTSFGRFVFTHVNLRFTP
jgi:hypothetical protein